MHLSAFPILRLPRPPIHPHREEEISKHSPSAPILSNAAVQSLHLLLLVSVAWCKALPFLRKLQTDLTPDLQRGWVNGTSPRLGVCRGSAQPLSGKGRAVPSSRDQRWGCSLPTTAHGRCLCMRHRKKVSANNRASRLQLGSWQGIRKPRSVMLPGQQWSHQAMPVRRQIYQLPHMVAIYREPFPAKAEKPWLCPLLNLQPRSTRSSMDCVCSCVY